MMTYDNLSEWPPFTYPESLTLRAAIFYSQLSGIAPGSAKPILLAASLVLHTLIINPLKSNQAQEEHKLNGIFKHARSGCLAIS